jgi:hypothetical protein
MRTFRYAGAMIFVGNETYLIYTDYKSEVCLYQRFTDQMQVCLVEVKS